MAQVYNAAKSKNPNYWCLISCPGHGIDIITDMPEQLTLGVSSEWDSRLPYSLASILDNMTAGAGSAIAGAIGMNVQSQDLSYQMWMGTTPIEIPLTLNFDHETDAQIDVFEPITKLMALQFPTNKLGGFLSPPGPLRSGQGNGGDYAINIRIGRMMTFLNCIMVSGNQAFDSRLDKKGFAISGQVEATFRSSIVYGHMDWLKAMQLTPMGT
jgi:hypothetical protein